MPSSFGSLDGEPFVLLDRDDRTGATDSGENLTINLDHTNDFARLLVFVTIYSGAPTFEGIDSVATLFPAGAAPIEIRTESAKDATRTLALFLVTNTGGDLVVQREARYIVAAQGLSAQQATDQAYSWGLSWVPAKPKS